jgi:hypothetical protein
MLLRLYIIPFRRQWLHLRLRWAEMCLEASCALKCTLDDWPGVYQQAK